MLNVRGHERDARALIFNRHPVVFSKRARHIRAAGFTWLSRVSIKEMPLDGGGMFEHPPFPAAATAASAAVTAALPPFQPNFLEHKLKAFRAKCCGGAGLIANRSA